MPIADRLPTLSEVVSKQLLFLGRADVQNQFLAIALSLILGWLLSKWLWRRLRSQFPQSTRFIWGDKKLPPRQYLAVLIQHLDFPLISLIALNLIHTIFFAQTWTRGLLNIAIQMMWVYLIYRLFLVFLYAVFPLATVRQYHVRLFAPLLILFIARTIINLYSNLEQLAQISLFNLFNTPITFRSIFWLIAGLYFWIVVVTLLERLLLNIFRTRNQLELGALEASLLLMRYFLIALGITLILGFVNVNVTALAAITGGLSVGIGFGLQQVVSNFVSGILLLFEKVLKPGDIISVEGQTCEVKHLGIRATTVRLLTDNSEKIIPNQTFFTTDVTTYTGSDRLVNCSILIGVGYASQSQEVMQLLLEIAKAHPSVLKVPVTSVFLLDFGDSSLNFELKFWLNDVNIRKRVISDLNCAILEKFTEHEIEIPFPQRDIHLKLVPEQNS